MTDIANQILAAQLETTNLLRQMAESQKSYHDQHMAQMNDLRQVADRQADTARQQADTARQQSDNVQRFATIFADQARAIANLTQAIQSTVEAANRSAQASEAAAVIAQDNQNAIRDLIATLQERG
jgi:methyl-accepting chemotaxis protein